MNCCPVSAWDTQLGFELVARLGDPSVEVFPNAGT